MTIGLVEQASLLWDYLILTQPHAYTVLRTYVVP
jgi:hypothetical protein